MNDAYVTRWQAASIRTIDIEGRLAQLLRAETLAHVRRVADFARILAEHHGVDPDRAELAALLHEVAAPYSDNQLLALAEYYEIPVSRTETLVPELVHGKVGAEILHNEWGINDEELLNAVRHHVAGAAQMGTTEKIIFLADKLEPARDRFYRDLDPIRALALDDLDAAIASLAVWRDIELPTRSEYVRDRFAAAENSMADLARTSY